MGRPRKLWAYTHGEHGAKVRIFEKRLGGILRFDYRDATGRHRPEVRPALRVRTPDGQLDEDMKRAAISACKDRQKDLEELVGTRRSAEPDYLTIGGGFRLFFDPKRAALPPSPQARKHHTGSRAFWELELGKDSPWDATKPADVKGALRRLVDKGQVATALKRLANLRTVYRWLRDDMAMDLLRDPTRGIKSKEYTQGYTPRRPRYTPEEVGKMVTAAPQLGARFNLFATLLFQAGPRGGQVREAMRSGLNCPLEPPPPAGFAPHGWLMLPGVKHQLPMLIALTARARAALDAALAGYLAPWEAENQETGADYPLIPGGRVDRGLIREPISDKGLRKAWPKLEKLAGVPTLSRRVFHGGRRSWVDQMVEAIGTDAASAAGGWSDSDMVTDVYASPRQYGLIERARKAQEAQA
jgi:hypothetical protein